MKCSTGVIRICTEFQCSNHFYSFLDSCKKHRCPQTLFPACLQAPKGPLLPVSQMPRSGSGKLTNGKVPQLVPLPVGKGQGIGGPDTPPGREEDQHGSANGSSRKGPSAIMRPRSTQTIVAAEAVRWGACLCHPQPGR